MLIGSMGDPPPEDLQADRELGAASNSLPPGPELYFGIVAAVGTDTPAVVSYLTGSLSQVAYEAEVIHLSKLLRTAIPSIRGRLREAPEDERYRTHMEAGSRLRLRLQRSDAMGLLAIHEIRKLRTALTGSPEIPGPRHAYIIRSLKTKAEVELLRDVYGDRFVLVSAYTDAATRRDDLVKRIRRPGVSDKTAGTRADELLATDEYETAVFGQRVRDAFPLADVFIDPREGIAPVSAFVNLFFGEPYKSPSRHELNMFHAYGASARSASMSRQVGAAIYSQRGDLLATGTNEVPKGGGGQYWEGDGEGHRDHEEKEDRSDRMMVDNVAELFVRLKAHGWQAPPGSTARNEDLAAQAVGTGGALKGVMLLNIVEYVRAVHAEMAAIAVCAERGTSVQEATMATTTFPCHDCAKHIVAAGIHEVRFIDPYPKSLVADLYADSIAIDSESGCPPKVSFRPFVGVAPRRFLHLFLRGSPRKTADGRTLAWNPKASLPRVTLIAATPPFEARAAKAIAAYVR